MAETILLLGAGFSRNWGGWLASEALEYLLGCPQVDDSLRSLLLQHKNKGFEAALEVLQAAPSPELRLANLEQALQAMFEAMNRAFQATTFESHDKLHFTVRYFLRRFDMIFTLNQDCLLEIHYFSHRLFLEARDRWAGYVIPGIESFGEPNWANPAFVKWRPSGQPPALTPNHQPYIKLHGSSEWVSSTNNLIMGGNKGVAIQRHPILAWGMKTFEETLMRPDIRLMVIGYSFRDDHINSIIEASVKRAGTTLFIVDPLGMDVLNHSAHGGAIPATSVLAQNLWPFVRGSSRRPLSSTFGTDRAEHAKLMRFITS